MFIIYQIPFNSYISNSSDVSLLNKILFAPILPLPLVAVDDYVNN